MSQQPGSSHTNVNAAGYVPDIIDYAKWPSVSVRYTFNLTDAKPNLQLSFNFDGSKYLSGDVSLVETDLATMRMINAQLNWQYITDDEDGNPGVALNTVQHSATCSIAPLEPLIFGAAQLNALKNYTSVIVAWLQLILNPGENGLPDSPSTMSVSLPIEGDEETNDIFELTVALGISRTDQASNAIPILKHILPDLSADNKPAFAQNFEPVFKATDNHLKLATGASLINSNNANQLWIIRMADAAAAKGVFYDIINDGAVAFAPTPIATSLFSGDVNIRDYVSLQGINWLNEGKEAKLKNIDPDQWLLAFLSAIDDLLLPAKATVIDRVTNVFENKSDLLDNLRNEKDSIILQLVKRLTPILAGQSGDLLNARQQLTDELNNKLANFYSGSTLQFKGTLTSTAHTKNFKLLGPVLTISGADGAYFSDNFISLDGFTSFTVYANTPSQQTYSPVSASLKPAKVLYQPEDTIATTLSFIIPPADKPVSANVPFALRSYPDVPGITDQAIINAYPNSDKLEDVKLFDYTYIYNTPIAAQDILETRITLNPSGNNTLLASQPADGLLQILAQFNSTYPAIKQEFDKYLPLSNDDLDPQSQDLRIVINALVTFNQLAGKLNEALTTDAGNNVALSAQNTGLVNYAFKLMSGPVNPILDTRFMITVSAKKADLSKYQLPVVSIDGYETIADTATASDIDSVAVYTYNNAVGEPLRVDNNDQELMITISGFDVLETLQIVNSTSLSRNKNLLPNGTGDFFETDSRFIYNTLKNNWAPVMPVLNYTGTEFNLASLFTGTGKAGIKEYIRLMLNQFFGNVPGVFYGLSINASYEYKLTPDDFMVVKLPIFVVNDLEISADNANELAGNLEAELQAWQEATTTLPNEGARFVFDVSVSTSLRPGSRLLQVQGIYLNLSDVN